MKAKHTPGPWKLEIPPHMNGKRKKTPFEHGREFIIWTTEGHRVGLVDGPSNADMEEKFMANALLIAAAPDLLAALEEAEFALHRAAEQYATDKPHRSTVLDGRLAIVRQAIAQARGGE